MTSPQPAFGDYQLEIYLAGLQGVLPAFPVAFADLEARAAGPTPTAWRSAASTASSTSCGASSPRRT
jgi:lactate 2-monooxygenase